MRNPTVRTALLSVSHFAVDFSCALLIYRRFAAGSDVALVILLYNFCAFAMQMPFGILADSLGKPHRFAALGCGLCALAYLIPAAIPGAVILGLGNALFHVGGGCEVMETSPDRAAPLGVFVSPGAFGIYFGAILGAGSFPIWIAPIALVLLGAGCLLRKDTAPVVSHQTVSHSTGLINAILALSVVVVLRSYGGFAQVFEWKTGVLALLAVCATVFGKTAGGFLSDRIGLGLGGVLSLGAAAVLFLFSWSPVCGLLAILLFNLTMPMTLFALARRLPERRGFSFGLLTFALFLGFLPKYFGSPAPLSTGLLLCIVCLVSLALYLPAVRGNAHETAL